MTITATGESPGMPSPFFSGNMPIMPTSPYRWQPVTGSRICNALGLSGRKTDGSPPLIHVLRHPVWLDFEVAAKHNGRGSKQRSNKIAAAAKHICGAVGEPDGLRLVLERIVVSELEPFASNRSGPTRKTVKVQIRRAAAAAKILRNLIAKETPAMWAICSADRNDQMKFPALLGILDHEFLPRTKLALARLTGKSGPGKYADKQRIAARRCALAINEAWRFVHGEYPKPSSDAACKATDALFFAAGGKQSTYKHVASSSGRWKKPLKWALPDDSWDDGRKYYHACMVRYFDGHLGGWEFVLLWAWNPMPVWVVDLDRERRGFVIELIRPIF